jgi:hypothetical protein
MIAILITSSLSLNHPIEKYYTYPTLKRYVANGDPNYFNSLKLANPPSSQLIFRSQHEIMNSQNNNFQFPILPKMRYLSVFASILAVAAADDFGSWSLYCGSSVRYFIYFSSNKSSRQGV